MEHVICIVGDSGVYASGINLLKSWAGLLRQYIEGVDDGSKVYALGICGDTTENVLARLEIELNARKPDVIIFNIGTNDSLYRGESRETTDKQFSENIGKIITIAKHFTEQIYFTGLAMGDDKLTQPLAHSSSGKCYSKIMVGRYDLLLKMAVEACGARYIQIAQVLNDSDFMDGLHPNMDGHAKIYQEIKNTIQL